MTENLAKGSLKSDPVDKSASAQPKRILIVDDDRELRESLEDFLNLQNFSVLAVGNAAAALKIVEQTDVELVLTDLVMPEMDGIALSKAIRASGKEIPILVMTGYASIEYAMESMKAGATDFITKPLMFDHVLFSINRVLETGHWRRMAQQTEFYRELSNRDGLTMISNYRHFSQMLQQEIERQLRYHRPLTLLIIDIDDFKKCNDTHGHLSGDLVLVKVASILNAQIRKCDFVARYGGDEFTVILPEISEREALAVARRIMKAVGNHTFQSFDRKGIEPLSVTIGIASFPKNAQESKGLIEKADQAMYSGKRAGKNCACIYGEENDIIRLRKPTPGKVF